MDVSLYVGYLKWTIFLNNSLWNYLISLWVFLLLVLIFVFIQRILFIKLKSFQSKFEAWFVWVLLELVVNFPKYILVFICLYFPLKYLNISNWFHKLIDSLLLILLTIESISIIMKIVDYRLLKMFLDKDKNWDKTKMNLFKILIHWSLWIIWILLILINMWFEITPLLTSLWIGWIAIAFALQNILQDIFSSFSIYFDKPFKIWDFVSVGTDSWTIEKIWIKSTHIKTLQWQMLIVSNKELTNARVNNFRMMKNRRVEFVLWFTYETSSDKLKKIPDIIRSIFSNYKIVVLNRVHFVEFGAYSLNFKIVFTVNSKKIEDELEVLNSINYEIFEIMNKEWISFAYPTQTIFMNK